MVNSVVCDFGHLAWGFFEDRFFVKKMHTYVSEFEGVYLLSSTCQVWSSSNFAIFGLNLQHYVLI